MKLILNKRPKNVTIIQGFPSFGLVSTIAIKFLIDHLDVEEIGSIDSERITPLTVIHKGKVISPITLFYNKKHNLLIIQSLTEVNGSEWDLSSTILDLAKSVEAKELVVLESKPSQQGTLEVYYYSTKNKLKWLKEIKEGIVMGTTAATLLKSQELPITCLFAEAHSQLPDSESAAKVIDVLNKYLSMKVDYKPLLETAKKFEESLKQYMSKIKENSQKGTTNVKDTDYFG